MPEHAAAVRSLAAVYIDVRRGAGLQPARLDQNALASLSEIENFRRIATALGVSLGEAVLEISRVAAGKLDISQRLVVDAALSLGVVRAELDDKGRKLKDLYAGSVMTRRKALAAQWFDLHERLGAAAPDGVSESKVRTQLEGPALEALADAAVRLRPDEIISPDKQIREVSDRPRVVVVGSAVMDVIFRVPHIPEAETSVQAHDFDLHPGGKGLTQAVAAVRLGMDVSLAAAIGMDYFGDRIMEYLAKEGVGTDLIRRYDAQTPVTGVIVHSGRRSSIALGWKNESGLRLSEDDAAGWIAQAAGQSDFLFATFEPPVRTLEALFLQIRRMKGNRPVVFLTPAPPYENPPLAVGALSSIDYLVATDWEARALVDEPEDSAPESVGRHVLNSGVGCICMPIDRQVFVYRHDAATYTVPPWPSYVHDTAGSRDALVAATALQLWRHGKQFDLGLISWAAAAMATSSSMKGVVNSMPTEDDVNRFIKQHVPPVVDQMPNQSSSRLVKE